MGYDAEKIELKDIEILSEFYKEFDYANVTYLSDLINDDFETISNKLKLGFVKAYKLKELINKLKLNYCITDDKITESIKDNENNDKMMFNYISIIKLNLSTRSFKYLLQHNIFFISKLSTIDKNFRNEKGIGQGTYCEISKIIKDFNDGKLNYLIDIFKESEPFLKKTNMNIEELNLSANTMEKLKKNHINSVDYIINLTYDDFYNTGLLGKKSANEVIEVLKTLKENILFNDPDNLIEVIKSYKDWVYNFVYNNKTLNKFDLSGLNFDLKIKLNINDNTTFLELYNEIANDFNRYTIDELISIIRFLKCNTPNELIYKLDLNITDEELNIIIKRSNGVTLEEIATSLNLTRERIRQKESKIKEKIQNVTKKLNLNNYMLNDVYDEETVTPVCTYSFKKYFPILDYLIDVKKINVDNRTYFIDNDYLQRCNDKLNELIEQIKIRGFIFENEIDLSIIDSRIFKALLNEMKIQFNENTYYMSSKNYDKIVAYIKRFGLIDLSEENLDNIKNELKFYLDYDEFDKHNIVAGLGRRNVVSMGDSRYSLSDNLPDIDELLIEEIIKTINEEKLISCNDLVSKYKDRLYPSINPSILYSKLKEMFNDDYNFGGVNLSISVKGITTSKASLIYDYLINSEEPVKIVELMNTFKVDKVALSVVKSQNKDIFNIDNVNYWLFSKMSNLDILVENVNEYIQHKQSFFINDMYRYFKDKFSELLLSNKISTNERFINVVRNKCSEQLNDFEYDRFKKYYYKKNKTVEKGFDFEF